MLLVNAVRRFEKGYFATCERSEKTREAYSCDLAQFRSFVGSGSRLSQLGPEIIERWASHLRKLEYAPASVRRKMATLRVFFLYWVRREQIAASPFWRVRLSLGRCQPLPRCLNRREMKALLRQAEHELLRFEVDAICPGGPGFLQLRNLAVVDLFFATGVRVGELTSLDVGDFSAEERTYRVRGKGGRMRLAFLVERGSVSIQEKYFQIRQATRTENGALFLNRLGSRLSTQGVANALSKLARQAAIGRHVTPHMLRHTVATLLLSNGVDLRIVQEFLGHASITSTQRYTHVSKDHLLSTLRKRHPVHQMTRTSLI